MNVTIMGLVLEGDSMWLVYACGSALFAGITSILAKCGIKKTDSTVATALRTIVVLAFAWIMVFMVGSQNQMGSISLKSLVFLILSGFCTGASWLCYFYALSKGPIDKVVPIDKSSTVLTIILALVFLQESISLLKIVCMLLIGIGTYLMIDKKGNKEDSRDNKWLLAAFGSAIFASLTAILGKVGMNGIESNLGTALRTCVVLVMAWMMVGVQKKKVVLYKNEFLFLVLSGVATGASWLCYYKALQMGPASVVVPIDKLSILVTILFSYLVFKEKLSKKSLLGLILLVLGTLLMIVA